MRLALFLVVLLVVGLSAPSAWAIAAPMSPEDLFAASDLVALVRVLSVTCVAIIHRGSEDLRRYTAELGLLKVRKGNQRRYEVVTVEWEETPAGQIGPWYVPYGLGAKGWTHLQGQDGHYQTTWWNGADNGLAVSRKRLPSTLMQKHRAGLAFRAPFGIARALRLLSLRRGRG
jgi:hypothetical protein